MDDWFEDDENNQHEVVDEEAGVDKKKGNEYWYDNKGNKSKRKYAPSIHNLLNQWQLKRSFSFERLNLAHLRIHDNNAVGLATNMLYFCPVLGLLEHEEENNFYKHNLRELVRNDKMKDMIVIAAVQSVRRNVLENFALKYVDITPEGQAKAITARKKQLTNKCNTQYDKEQFIARQMDQFNNAMTFYEKYGVKELHKGNDLLLTSTPETNVKIIWDYCDKHGKLPLSCFAYADDHLFSPDWDITLRSDLRKSQPLDWQRDLKTGNLYWLSIFREGDAFLDLLEGIDHLHKVFKYPTKISSDDCKIIVTCYYLYNIHKYITKLMECGSGTMASKHLVPFTKYWNDISNPKPLPTMNQLIDYLNSVYGIQKKLKQNGIGKICHYNDPGVVRVSPERSGSGARGDIQRDDTSVSTIDDIGGGGAGAGGGLPDLTIINKFIGNILNGDVKNDLTLCGIFICEHRPESKKWKEELDNIANNNEKYDKAASVLSVYLRGFDVKTNEKVNEVYDMLNDSLEHKSGEFDTTLISQYHKLTVQQRTILANCFDYAKFEHESEVEDFVQIIGDCLVKPDINNIVKEMHDAHLEEYIRSKLGIVFLLLKRSVIYDKLLKQEYYKLSLSSAIYKMLISQLQNDSKTISALLQLRDMMFIVGQHFALFFHQKCDEWLLKSRTKRYSRIFGSNAVIKSPKYSKNRRVSMKSPSKSVQKDKSKVKSSVKSNDIAMVINADDVEEEEEEEEDNDVQVQDAAVVNKNENNNEGEEHDEDVDDDDNGQLPVLSVSVGGKRKISNISKREKTDDTDEENINKLSKKEDEKIDDKEYAWIYDNTQVQSYIDMIWHRRDSLVDSKSKKPKLAKSKHLKQIEHEVHAACEDSVHFNDLNKWNNFGTALPEFHDGTNDEWPYFNELIKTLHNNSLILKGAVKLELLNISDFDRRIWIAKCEFNDIFQQDLSHELKGYINSTLKTDLLSPHNPSKQTDIKNYHRNTARLILIGGFLKFIQFDVTQQLTGKVKQNRRGLDKYFCKWLNKLEANVLYSRKAASYINLWRQCVLKHREFYVKYYDNIDEVNYFRMTTHDFDILWPIWNNDIFVHVEKFIMSRPGLGKDDTQLKVLFEAMRTSNFHNPYGDIWEFVFKSGDEHIPFWETCFWAEVKKWCNTANAIAKQSLLKALAEADDYTVDWCLLAGNFQYACKTQWPKFIVDTIKSITNYDEKTMQPHGTPTTEDIRYVEKRILCAVFIKYCANELKCQSKISKYTPNTDYSGFCPAFYFYIEKCIDNLEDHGEAELKLMSEEFDAIKVARLIYKQNYQTPMKKIINKHRLIKRRKIASSCKIMLPAEFEAIRKLYDECEIWENKMDNKENIEYIDGTNAQESAEYKLRCGPNGIMKTVKAGDYVYSTFIVKQRLMKVVGVRKKTEEDQKEGIFNVDIKVLNNINNLSGVLMTQPSFGLQFSRYFS